MAILDDLPPELIVEIFAASTAGCPDSSNLLSLATTSKYLYKIYKANKASIWFKVFNQLINDTLPPPCDFEMTIKIISVLVKRTCLVVMSRKIYPHRSFVYVKPNLVSRVMQLDVTTLIHPCMYGECLTIMKEYAFSNVVEELAPRLEIYRKPGPTPVSKSDIEWDTRGEMELFNDYRGRRLWYANHFIHQVDRALSLQGLSGYTTVAGDSASTEQETV